MTFAAYQQSGDDKDAEEKLYDKMTKLGKARSATEKLFDTQQAQYLKVRKRLAAARAADEKGKGKGNKGDK